MKTVEPILAQSIRAGEKALVIVLARTGEEVAIPWERCSAQLAAAAAGDRVNCELSPGGYGVHWPALDEDLSIAGLLARKNG